MPFTLQFRLAVVVLVAECLNVAQVAEGVQEFKRCYNTLEEESHCFDVQYYANDQPLHTSFLDAKLRCKDLNSTLVIIENEKIGSLVQQFMRDNSNPLQRYYFWLNAYQVNEFDNTYYRWHWLNTTLQNIAGSAVTYTYNSDYYAAVLEFRSDNGKLQIYLTAKQPQSSSYYVCEYSVSNCSSSSSNDVRLMNGRCYRAIQELVPWYEARNRCLKDGGDLASFSNVTSINFTSWLRSESYTRYWIGLRFIWYTWGDSGQELKYTKWATNDDLRGPCVIFCYNCNPIFTWSSKDCSTTDSVYVVCHTITPLVSTTTASMVKASISAASASSTTTLLTLDIQQVTPSSSRATYGPASDTFGFSHNLLSSLKKKRAAPLPSTRRHKMLAFHCLFRSKTPLEQKTRSDRTELGAVQEPPVGQINESANSPYEQLNRNLDNTSGPMYDELRVEVGAVQEASVGQVNDSANNPYEQLNRNLNSSSGPMYDELRVAPETQYEEVPSNRA